MTFNMGHIYMISQELTCYEIYGIQYDIYMTYPLQL